MVKEMKKKNFHIGHRLFDGTAPSEEAIPYSPFVEIVAYETFGGSDAISISPQLTTSAEIDHQIDRLIGDLETTRRVAKLALK